MGVLGTMTLLEVERMRDTVLKLSERVALLEDETARLRQLAKTGGSYDFAAQVTGYARQTLYSKVSKKNIPYTVRLGKPWFEIEDLEKWMDDPKGYNREYWENQIVSDIKKAS